MKVKPDFFIVGAAKSGTTSLYQYLAQHPEVYFSPIKEPNYFSNDIDISKFSSIYKKNTFLDTENFFSKHILKELDITFVRKIEDYERLFEKGDKFKTRGEGSTSYLYSQNAGKNIFKYNPQSKIIIVLRNPVERAFSHYKMALRTGHTKLNFREALENDINAKNKGWGISELFIDLGLYYEQLMRYFSVFPKEQIKVFLYDDFKKSAKLVLQECFDFIGVSDAEIDDQKIYNPAIAPKSVLLNYFLTRSGLKNIIKKTLPESQINTLKKSFLKPDSNVLIKEDYEFLLNIYYDDIKKTASLINKDLSSWLDFDRI